MSATFQSHAGVVKPECPSALQTRPRDRANSEEICGFIWDRFALDISAASEIPFSRLFGPTASGLSNTGEGDEILWENRVQNLQGEQLDPQMDKLFPVVAMSTWGQVPTDFSWRWMPIREVGSKDQAELAKNKSDVVLQAFNAGLISNQVALQELSLLAEETGMWATG
ncbi:MAG: anti-CBASS Acb1 family protein [Acidobacteriaceae bacterium]